MILSKNASSTVVFNVDFNGISTENKHRQTDRQTPSPIPKGELSERGALSVNEATKGGMRGGMKLLPSDDQLLPLFAERSPENRNALWDAISSCWDLPTGDRLAHSWDGFCDAFLAFDPAKAAPGFMAKTFLRLVDLSCRSVRRQDRATNGPALRIPLRARRRIVRLTPEEWAELSDIPDDAPTARLEGVDGQIRVVGLHLIGSTSKRLEKALKRAVRERSEK